MSQFFDDTTEKGGLVLRRVLIYPYHYFFVNNYIIKLSKTVYSILKTSFSPPPITMNIIYYEIDNSFFSRFINFSAVSLSN